jgi:hypothetical protein
LLFSRPPSHPPADARVLARTGSALGVRVTESNSIAVSLEMFASFVWPNKQIAKEKAKERGRGTRAIAALRAPAGDRPSLRARVHYRLNEFVAVS